MLSVFAQQLSITPFAMGPVWVEKQADAMEAVLLMLSNRFWNGSDGTDGWDCEVNNNPLSETDTLMYKIWGRVSENTETTGAWRY